MPEMKLCLKREGAEVDERREVKRGKGRKKGGGRKRGRIPSQLYRVEYMNWFEFSQRESNE